jgi:hypothetical protein
MDRYPYSRFSDSGVIHAETVRDEYGVVINIEIYADEDRDNGEGSKLLQEYIQEAISLDVKTISAVMLPKDPNKLEELAHFYFINGFKRRVGNTMYYDVD